MTLTRAQADEVRASALETWEPRSDIAARYGVKLSNVYAVLSNRAHHDPEYDRYGLATPIRHERGRATPWKIVDEIRSIRQTKYVSPSVLSRQFGVDETYDRSTLVQRDDIRLREMRTSGFIYGLYCVCGECDSDKIQYVGQTVQSPEKRLSAHRNPTGKDRYTKRARWTRDHGPENIQVRVLETDPEDGLDVAEVRNILAYDTLVPNGYNMTPGGYAGAGHPGEENNSAKLTRAQVEEIIARLEEPGVTSRGLAADYGVTKTLILKIDHGDLWPEVFRPYGTHRLNRNRRMNLTHDDVRMIRTRFSNGEKIASIARDMGQSWHVVSNAARGKTWTDVQ